MYCHKCGKQSSDTAKFCANCGAELIKNDTMAKSTKKELKGVSGWLAFFIIAVLVSSIGDFYWSSIWFEITPLLGILSLGLGAYGLYVAYLLGRVKQNALLNAKIFLIIHALENFGLLIFLAANSNDPNNDNTSAVRGLVYSLIWLWYLFASKRVKNTYAT